MDRLLKYSIITVVFLCCCLHSTAQKKEHQWGQWTVWSACSTSCGYGVQTRTRTLNMGSEDYNNPDDIYTRTEIMQCFPVFCPINGSWTMWGIWGECSKGCGVGIRKRHRSCTEPKPDYGGANCTGESFKEGQCNINPCPELPMNFNMSQCGKSSMFTCHSKQMCVPKSKRCDGEAHCHDGTDEVGCRRSDIGHVRFSNASGSHSSSCILALMAALLSSWFVKLFIGGQRHTVDQSAPRP